MRCEFREPLLKVCDLTLVQRQQRFTENGGPSIYLGERQSRSHLSRLARTQRTGSAGRQPFETE